MYIYIYIYICITYRPWFVVLHLFLIFYLLGEPPKWAQVFQWP